MTKLGLSDVDQLQHAHWMCIEAARFPPEKIEKKMRWLGFVQGVRFANGVTTIADAKRDNMPPGETFSV